MNPIEMLWHDLKMAVHAREPSNLRELAAYLSRRVVGQDIPGQMQEAGYRTLTITLFCYSANVVELACMHV
jgi:hypothetical protein